MTAAPSDAPAPTDAERRQLTVMFCDLVGSTELSARLDPEDLRDVIAAYHRAVADVVAGFDGFVAKYMGDCVWPISATRERRRTMPSGRSGRGWASSTLSVASISNPSSCSRCIGIATGSPSIGSWRGQLSVGRRSSPGVVKGATGNYRATWGRPD